MDLPSIQGVSLLPYIGQAVWEMKRNKTKQNKNRLAIQSGCIPMALHWTSSLKLKNKKQILKASHTAWEPSNLWLYQ